MIVTNIQAYYAVGFGPEVRAVDGVSLSIRDGEVFGIVGESGCGKSTLASVLSLTANRSLKIKSGEMNLDGEKLRFARRTRVPPYWHGEMVALLPQRAMNSLNPTRRIRHTIIDVIHAHRPGFPVKEIMAQAQDRLEQLSLPVRVLDSYPHQLSGGMRQRVVAVIATLLDPYVLIADEPTSALDVSSQQQFVTMLREFLIRRYITRIIYITHDLPMLSNIADRIAVMYAGKIVEIGTTEEIVTAPKHPYTQALIASTLDLDPELRKHRLTGIQGTPPDLRTPPDGCRFHPRCTQVIDICSHREPPVTGDENRFAACWLVQSEAQAAENFTEQIAEPEQ